MHHPLPHFVQPRARLHLTPIPARHRILGSAPQDLPRGASPRPHYIVDIDGISLLAPHVDFAAKDEVGAVGGDTGERVVGVDEAPVVEGRAVVEKRVGGGGTGGFEIDPLASAAVEVLWKNELGYWGTDGEGGEIYPEVVVTHQGFVTLGNGISDRLVTEPCLYDDVRTEGQIPY